MPDKSRNPSQVKATIAAKRPRDANGHFIKSDVVSIQENKTSNDETLIDVKVTNPLHRITMLLKDIKRRQATTVDLKFTIPLIALPVFMLIAFSLGKNAAGITTCGGATQTKIGVMYILKPNTQNNETFTTKITGLLSYLPYVNILNTKQLAKPNRPILIQRDNTAITIISQKSVNLTPYQTRQIFATGIFNSCENSLQIENEDDIQLVP